MLRLFVIIFPIDFFFFFFLCYIVATILYLRHGDPSM